MIFGNTKENQREAEAGTKSNKDIKLGVTFILNELSGILVPFKNSDAWKISKEQNKAISEMLWQSEIPDDLRTSIEEAKDAINTILSKNWKNIWTNILDFIPLGILSTGNFRVALIGFLWLLISFIFSYREFKYRREALRPKMKDIRRKYSEHMWESVKNDESLSDLDFIIESFETLWELIAYIAPNIIIPSFLVPVLEISLDTNSRKKYYHLLDELEEMTRHIKKNS